jgi:hypothetical protein
VNEFSKCHSLSQSNVVVRQLVGLLARYFSVLTASQQRTWRPAMKYVLLIYQPDAFDPKSLPPEEHQAIADQYQSVTSTPQVTPGLPLGLPQDAMTVRVNNGETQVSDGPYVDVAGTVGGYFIFEADTKEEAVALAARVPAARLGGAVEIRPAQAYW